jgi:hypothetical protein
MQQLLLSRDKQKEEQKPLNRRFNWGAFFLTWIWAIGNRSLDAVTLVLLALCIVPYVNLPAAISLALYSGFTGNRRALRREGRWRSDEHFMRVQRRWAIVGGAQFFLVILALLFLPLFYEK